MNYQDGEEGPTSENMDSYLASLDKHDTIVRKPVTWKLTERPKVEPTARWGDVFLGDRAKLTIIVAEFGQDPIEVEVTDRVIIGRAHAKTGEKADIDLKKYGGHFSGVSRRHAAIIKEGNTLQVMDLGSTNGTYLNGQKMQPNQPRLLRDGDELCLGQLILNVNYGLMSEVQPAKIERSEGARMTETKGKVVHYTDVPAQVYGDAAPGTSIRWLIDDEHDGAPVYALRMIEIEPGGHSPHHSHPYEHENFVIEGEGRVFLNGAWIALKVGDVVLVPGNMEHQYENTGESTFKFLCGIPVKRLMPKA